MKLIEYAVSMPNRMGAAEIEWKTKSDDSRIPLAERNGPIISLVPIAGMRIYLLKDEKQFLYAADDYTGRRKLYFGGMDESPFLVEMSLPVVEGLIAGEEAFFESLKPRVVHKMENLHTMITKRQGDFFATGPKKPIRWPDFFRRYVGNGKMQTSIVEKMSLFGTRHQFSGFVAEADGKEWIIGEGTIEAPDHKPLEIKGPHLIAQATFLVAPKQAD